MRRNVCLLSFVLVSLLMSVATGCGAAQEAPTPADVSETAASTETSEASAPAAAEVGGSDMGSGDFSEPVETVTPEYAEGEELLCLCDNEEEAQKIADLYGIELVQFQFGVATFHAEDPQSVIDLGKEKGYPELEINAISHIYDN